MNLTTIVLGYTREHVPLMRYSKTADQLLIQRTFTSTQRVCDNDAFDAISA